MRIFDLKQAVLGLPQQRLGDLRGSIEEYRKDALRVDSLPNVAKLKGIARQSGTVSSCARSNVFLSDVEEKNLFEKGLPPTNLQTKICKGYLDALDMIDETFDKEEFTVSYITNIHYRMYEAVNSDIGGKFKDTQNYIQESLNDGTNRTIYIPAAPEEAYPLLDNLVWQFNLVAEDPEVDKLELIAVFLCDFLCIHPYVHGNSRLSRLLLYYLLKRFGYKVDEYYALSYVFEHRIGEYIDSFRDSAKGWGSGSNDSEPFVHFVLRSLRKAYRHLAYIVLMNERAGTVEEKVQKIVLDSSSPISKKVIEKVLYNANKATIEKSLGKLVKEGKIRLIARGASRKYGRL